MEKDNAKFCIAKIEIFLVLKVYLFFRKLKKKILSLT
jgi:hypothetical protein